MLHSSKVRPVTVVIFYMPWSPHPNSSLDNLKIYEREREGGRERWYLARAVYRNFAKGGGGGGGESGVWKKEGGGGS